MRFWTRRSLSPRSLSLFGLVGFSFGLAACSGNLGSGGVGGGLPIAPGGQGYGQPQGPAGQSGPTSRQRTLEGAVFVTPDLASIPLPSVGGFALSLNLGSPAPSTSVSPTPGGSASTSPAPAKKTSLLQRTARVVPQVVAQVTPPASAAAATPSAAPPAAASVAPMASGSPVAVPSPVGSGASAAPKTSGSPKAAAASPHPAGTGPKIETKLVVYPDFAPDAPTPEPTGNVQTYTKRKALVRGYISPAVDIALYGLGAARFTIPADEQTANRGFTVAIFSAAKKHKPVLIASDASATLASNVVSSSLATPLTLKKGMGYDIVLYGDELPSTPPPVPQGYATPGSNPFVTPTPAGYQPQPGYAQPGQPYPGQPYPGQTYPPGYATPTPFPGH